MLLIEGRLFLGELFADCEAANLICWRSTLFANIQRHRTPHNKRNVVTLLAALLSTKVRHRDPKGSRWITKLEAT